MYRAAKRDSVHNLFDIMSKDAIAADLFYWLATESIPDDTGGYYKFFSHHRTSEALRNLVWHEVKRGEVGNVKFLIEIMRDLHPSLVLGVPFFQEGTWDNIPNRELRQLQRYLHNSMGKKEQDISIRFAWLAGTPEGQQYIKNVSSKLKPKAYRSLKSGLKAWKRATHSVRPAYLVDYFNVDLIGASLGRHMYWDFNPFGKKLYDMLETALLDTQISSLSIDDSIAGPTSSIKELLLNSAAIQDLEETVKGYRWDLSKFSEDEYLVRCIRKLLLQTETKAAKGIASVLLSQLAEGLSCEEFSDRLSGKSKAAAELFNSFGINRAGIQVDAETFFDKGWLETLKDPEFQGAKLRTVVKASSPRGAKLALESMQTTDGRPCIVTNGQYWIAAVNLRTVLEHAEDERAAQIAWEYFDSWDLPGTPEMDALVDAWFKVFVDCGFFQKITENKPAEFWEQFIEVFKINRSLLTPPAVISLTEAITS